MVFWRLTCGNEEPEEVDARCMVAAMAAVGDLDMQLAGGGVQSRCRRAGRRTKRRMCGGESRVFARAGFVDGRCYLSPVLVRAAPNVDVDVDAMIACSCGPAFFVEVAQGNLWIVAQCASSSSGLKHGLATQVSAATGRQSRRFGWVFGGRVCIPHARCQSAACAAPRQRRLRMLARTMRFAT